MARKIGDVTIEGDYDGDRALEGARKNVKGIEKVLSDGMGDSGRKSGDSWAKEFGRVFGDRMRAFVKQTALPQFNKQMAETVSQSRDLARAGRDLDHAFPNFIDDIGFLRVLKDQMQEVGKGFDRLAIDSGAAGRAVRDSNRDLYDGSNALVVYEGSLNRAGGGAERLRRSHDGGFGQKWAGNIRSLIGWLFSYDKKVDGTNKKNSSMLSGWKSLSHNTRQWTLIISAVAAALPTLSVLGSAAGGALAVAGNAAVTLVASIGLAIVGFQGLFGETVQLTAGAEASKTAFQNLGQAFKDLQPGIVNAMFDSMAASIENLTANLIPGIEGNLYALSAAVGGAMSSLLDMFASPEAISIFNGLLETASKTVGPLLEGIGGLFLGILAVFEQASPLAESFSGWLQTIGTDFLAWTQSDSGRARISEWLETAERILPLVGELVVAAGQALADLVRPETIANTEGLLKNITSFMEPLSGLLNILGDLDVFGVLASLLNSVGQALTPLQEPMSKLASLIGTTLKSALDTLGPAFAALGDFLAPIISAVVDFLTPIFERLANDVLPVLVAAWGEIMTALAPVGVALQGLVDAMQPVVSFLIDVLLNAFNLVFPAIQFVVEMVVGIITGMINGLTSVFEGITMIVENWGSDWDAVWQGVWTVIQGVVEFIWNLIQATLIGKAFGLAKTGLTALGKFFTTIWTSIRTFVTTAINGVKTVIGNVMTAIKTAWNTAWTWVKTTVTTIWEGIKLVVTTVFNGVKTTITNVLNTVKSIWNTAWTWIKTTVTNIWNGIKTFVSEAITNVKTTITNILNAIKTAWQTQWNTLKSTVTNIWNAIKTAISTAIEAVKTTISNILNTIKNIWKTQWDTLKNTARDVWNGIKSVIQGPIDAIKGFINGLKGPIDAAIGWFNSLFGSADSAQNKASSASNSGGGGRRVAMATGGILRSATNVLAGEAGPEAFIPLNRPLSQVSPDVRWLSAIAQGKAQPTQTAVSSGPRVVFEAGSIVVQGAQDTRRTAHDVADVVAERIAS